MNELIDELFKRVRHPAQNQYTVPAPTQVVWEAQIDQELVHAQQVLRVFIGMKEELWKTAGFERKILDQLFSNVYYTCKKPQPSGWRM